MTEAAGERADRLEQILGDPFDPRGLVGFAAVAAADERREPVSAAAPLLAGFGLNAELVPTELGGRLRDVGGLIEVVHPLARRDPSLALAHVGIPLVGAVGLWTRGRDEQRRAGAELCSEAADSPPPSAGGKPATSSRGSTSAPRPQVRTPRSP